MAASSGRGGARELERHGCGDPCRDGGDLLVCSGYRAVGCNIHQINAQVAEREAVEGARGVEVDGHTVTTAHPDEIDIYDCINLPPPVVGVEEVDEEDLVSTGPAGGPPHPRSSLLEPGEAQEPTHLIRQ